MENDLLVKIWGKVQEIDDIKAELKRLNNKVDTLEENQGVIKQFMVNVEDKLNENKKLETTLGTVKRMAAENMIEIEKLKNEDVNDNQEKENKTSA